MQTQSKVFKDFKQINNRIVLSVKGKSTLGRAKQQANGALSTN